MKNQDRGQSQEGRDQRSTQNSSIDRLFLVGLFRRRELILSRFD